MKLGGACRQAFLCTAANLVELPSHAPLPAGAYFIQPYLRAIA